MEEIQDYINQNFVIKNEIYSSLESSIICIICLDIIIEPVMCVNCKNVYCKHCIDEWSKNNINCPHRCENPNYQKSIDLFNKLSQLSFNCKHCEKVISYNEMEKHLLSKCHLGKNVNNDNNNLQNHFTFKKLDDREILKEPETELKSKNLYLYIFFLIL